MNLLTGASLLALAKSIYYYLYALLNFDPLSRAFSNRYLFDENTQRIIVDRRRKSIEM